LTLASRQLAGDRRSANGKFQCYGLLAAASCHRAGPFTGNVGLTESEAGHAQHQGKS
jgi:hypothetical protein